MKKERKGKRKRKEEGRQGGKKQDWKENSNSNITIIIETYETIVQSVYKLQKTQILTQIT